MDDGIRAAFKDDAPDLFLGHALQRRAGDGIAAQLHDLLAYKAGSAGNKNHDFYLL